MSDKSQNVDELRESAQQLAKQTLETAELGLRLLRTQFETVVRPGAMPGAADAQRNLHDVTLNVESKAKEMFNLATNFMQELNDKWQPGTKSEEKAAEEKPRPEKINIDID